MAEATHLVSLDISVLDGLREIEPSLVEQVIDLFLGSAPTDIAKIAKAVTEKNPKELLAGAHGLKSASASVGAMAVSHFCCELEKMGRAGSVIPGESDELLKQLQNSFQVICCELPKHK
ncbi:MAG: Hpt domain-containing protein [Pseudobdellovibrionaceae bacterium]